MSKTFVYHRKAPDFTGTTLYPLNRLKEHFPSIYKEAKKNYEGREWLMKVIIPPLDCLWNDVIHMSLMHPSLIYRTLSEIGFEHHKIHRDWFEIPLCNVAVNSILYKNDRRKEDRREFLNSDFEPVSVGRVKELSGMPEINIEYYRECLEEKQYPLMWGYAPHLLLKGKLNVTNYRVFDWREDV